MANFFKASKAPKLATKTVEVTIERLDSHGCGVAKWQNKPLFIEGTLTNEKVSARVVEQRSKYSKGKLLAIDKPNEHRVEALCKHFLQCGGCDLQHLNSEEQRVFKQDKVAHLFSRNQIMQPLPWQEPLTAKPYNYRRKARIGVQYNKNNQAIIGFRRKATNNIQPIKHCIVLENQISELFTSLERLINQFSVNKSIGHIEVIATDVVTLLVRQIKPLNQADKQLWENFSKEYKYHVWFDLGDELQPLFSEQTTTALEYLVDDDIKITFSPSDFIQVNQQINQKMITQAINWLSLKTTDNVLDLFCGLGNFSLPIAKRVQRVVGVEGVQNMVDRAHINAKLNQLENCVFYQQNLNESWLDSSWAQHKFDIVVLDPARAGALEAVTQIVKLAPKKILYVSCDPATLARDSQTLIKHKYQIKKINIMDMFCQTQHVESMVLFEHQLN
jgi:23S rRNA (uracil1939-C5)-methyltransferase